MEQQNIAQAIVPPPEPETGSVLAKVAPLASVTIIAALGTSLVNVVLPEVAADFGVNMPAVQWVTLAFLLSSTVLIIPVGRWADTLGRPRVLKIGLGIFILASLAASLAPGLGVLIAARAVQGVGVAAMLSLPVALVRETVAGHQMGRAMGVIGASMATGMALGPALGGVLAASPFGWHGTFFLFVPLGVAALLLVLRKLPSATAVTVQRDKMDLVGLVLLALVLAGYAIALTVTPGGWPGTTGLLLLVALGLVLWVKVENRAAAPLVDLLKLRKLGIFSGLAMNFGGSLIMMTFTIIPPFYLTLGLGLDTGWMGLTMAVGPVAAILTGLPAGRSVDRWGATRMTGVGLATMTAGALSFVFLAPLWGVIGFLVAAVVLTPGNQIFMAANNTAIMSRAGARQQGAVSGMLNLARNLGFITGTAVMALLFNLAANHEDVTAGATLGMQISFGLAALVGMFAVLLAWLGTRREAAQPTPGTGFQVTDPEPAEAKDNK